MNKNKSSKNEKYDRYFFENVKPTKLTEARRIRLNTECWGILSDYYLESVKVTRLKSGEVYSIAMLKIGDCAGQISCLVKGDAIGLLFDVSSEKWQQIEDLCGKSQQIFYRYFKDGLSPNFGFNQRLFYNFCMSNQKSDVFVVIFRRSVNTRKRDTGDAFLDIIELRKCDHSILDLYTSHLRENVNKVC